MRKLRFLQLFEAFSSKMLENNGEPEWDKIIEDVFYDNYVKGNPDKFLTALEKVLEEKGYRKPNTPLKIDNFGQGLDIKRIIRNSIAINSRSADRKWRGADRIIQDTLINKFFNGDVVAAGKAYQDWIKKTRDLYKKTNSDGSDLILFKTVDDFPIWTPEEDIVEEPMGMFYLSHVFGGKYYEDYAKRDQKDKTTKDSREMTGKGMRRDQCPRCFSNGNMKWIKSEEDYPKGMWDKKEMCSRCNPSGEPIKMPAHSEYTTTCPICNNKECKCSYDRLKDVVDHYLEYEDYKSIANMKTYPFFQSFFDEFSKTKSID